MHRVVICEKPSQARNIEKAVGNSHGEILPARGHLLRLTLPHEENPDWRKWSADLLRPASGRYGLRPDTENGKSERLRQIGHALARCDTVFIATDCDREGQAIGEHILRYLDFGGAVKRVIFTAEDEGTLAKAFAAAEDNANYRHLYEAAVARQQADQIFNLSLTRAATVSLVPAGVRAVIGIGRVKTPTMAIVCKRERELREFGARDYFELTAEAAGKNGRIRLAHRPAAGLRIFDAAWAQRIRAAVEGGWTGPVSVRKERRHVAPPRPMDLAGLQQHAAEWGWTAKKTLDVAQALYETHQIITYPRSATRFLPEGLASAAIATYRALAAARLLEGGPWSAPRIRVGREGAFFDAGLDGEPHHAIMPNPSVASDFAQRAARLEADERRLFDAIAKSFAACLGPDHVYDRTEIAVEPLVDGMPIKFSAVGRMTIDEGWRACAGTDETVARDDEADVEDAEEQHRPAPFDDGEVVAIGDVTIETKVTVPPPRYTEGSLVKAMREAWKFVEDPDEQVRLKQCKGIGTPATRDSIIEGLKAQDFLVVAKGKLHASEKAMQLYALLSASCPELVDAGATARMESRLQAVVRGEASSDGVIDEICEVAKQLIETLTHTEKQKMDLVRKPSPQMVEAARLKAERAGMELPGNVIENYDECRAFLGPLPELRQPSEAQIAFAERVSARVGVAIPENERRDSASLSRWIDTHNMATEKQAEWIKKLVDAAQIEPPQGYPDRISGSDARKILDKAFGGKAGRALYRYNEAARAAETASGRGSSQLGAAVALASEKQVKWIRKIVERGEARPPAGYPDSVSAADAKKFLDAMFADEADTGPGKDQSRSGRVRRGNRGARGHLERAHRLNRSKRSNAAEDI